MKRSKWILLLLMSLAFAGKAETTDDGIKAIDYENYATARRILTKLIQQNPSDPKNYYYLGIVYSTLEKVDSARIIFNAGTQADPKSFSNFIGLGRTYLDQNNVQK